MKIKIYYDSEGKRCHLWLYQYKKDRDPFLRTAFNRVDRHYDSLDLYIFSNWIMKIENKDVINSILTNVDEGWLMNE